MPQARLNNALGMDAMPIRKVLGCGGGALSMRMILLHARPELSIRQKLSAANRLVADFIEGQRTMIPTI